jgi:hypothetical protein
MEEQAIEHYTQDGGSINRLEIEAETEEILNTGSKWFWSNIPVFD